MKALQGFTAKDDQTTQLPGVKGWATEASTPLISAKRSRSLPCERER